MTITVTDLGPLTAALTALDVDLPTQRLPIQAESIAEVSVGSFHDPDGNEITVVQPHPKASPNGAAEAG